MPHIKQLDPSLVNKIAAGEVIERPASVVKELIENALDAGATRIDITLEEGGVGLIRVTDNGCGIAPDDLPLAVAPHATSKITSSEDLFAIRSLGFRGEALASIASVSHLRIVSRPGEQLEGHEFICSDKTVEGPRPCAAPIGTTIEVRNLFFNVPARRKFLRQGPTEFSHATEQLARLALAHPDVAFSLSHNGRSSRSLPAVDDRRGRIADFYGAELAECLMAVDKQERGVRIEALLAPPAQCRASSKWQYLFVNGRYISDRRIGFAIREAFRGLIEHDRYPVVFIFLTTEPTAYDVNVHPTKIEVRWRDAGLIQSQVLAVLRETLLSHDLTPRLGFHASSLGEARTSIDGQSAVTGEAGHQARARQALADYLRSIDPTQARLRFQPPPFPTDCVRPSIRSTFVVGEGVEGPSRRPASEGGQRAEGYAGPAQRECADDTTKSTDCNSPATAANPQSEISNSKSEISNPKSEISNPKSEISNLQSEQPSDIPHTAFLNSQSSSSVIQVHNTYLVAQTDEGIVIIDQHALHERILYERFRERILGNSDRMKGGSDRLMGDGERMTEAGERTTGAVERMTGDREAPASLSPLEAQRLLIPQTFEATPTQVQTAQDHAELLTTLGIEVAPFGPRSLAVQSVPILLGEFNAVDFLRDLLDRIADIGEAPSRETLIHSAIDMMACKAAVKAGDVLTQDEMIALLAQRHLVDRSSNCPHGRPTTLQLTTRDLERQFKRV